ARLGSMVDRNAQGNCAGLVSFSGSVEVRGYQYGYHAVARGPRTGGAERNPSHPCVASVVRFWGRPLVGVSTLRGGSGEAPPWVSDGKNRRSDPVYECQSSTSRGSSTSVRRLGFRTPAPRRAEGSP